METDTPAITDEKLRELENAVAFATAGGSPLLPLLQAQTIAGLIARIRQEETRLPLFKAVHELLEHGNFQEHELAQLEVNAYLEAKETFNIIENRMMDRCVEAAQLFCAEMETKGPKYSAIAFNIGADMSTVTTQDYDRHEDLFEFPTQLLLIPHDEVQRRKAIAKEAADKKVVYLKMQALHEAERKRQLNESAERAELARLLLKYNPADPRTGEEK